MEPNSTPTTPQKGTAGKPSDPGSISWKLLLIQDARVHYVVLKQQPHTTHPTHNPTKRGQHAWRRHGRETRNKVPGPKPRSCCLRTQQCAKHYPTPTAASAFLEPGPEGPVRTNTTTGSTGHLFVDIPPMSTRHGTLVRATGLYS
jgi:hypothetical protein